MDGNIYRSSKRRIDNSKGDLIMSKFFIDTKIAGVTFEGRQKYVAKEDVGDRLYLRREKDNKYDPNAIAVYSAKQKKQLGYVPATVAKSLATVMDSGTSLKVVVTSVGQASGGYGPIGVAMQITWSGTNA